MKLQLTVITPTHTGTGDVYKENLDYYVSNGITRFIDFDALIEKIDEIPTAVDQISSERINISNICRQFRLNPEQFKTAEFNISASQEIRKQIKTGFGNHIIPGSSIKGALRTVLFAANILYNENLKKQIYDSVIRDRNIYKPEKLVFGPDPFTDFMKYFLVRDSEFKINSEMIYSVKVMSMDQDLKKGYKKNLRQSGNLTTRYEEGQPIFIEAIKPNQTSGTEIAITHNPRSSNIIATNDFLKKCLDENNLISLCNRVAEYYIENEIAFFEKIHFTEMINFYKKLLETTKLKNTFLLHLGWGSGWTGMTGNWMDEDEQLNIKRNLRLSRNNDDYPVFPKTRRIVSINGQPSCVTGWVKLTKVSN